MEGFVAIVLMVGIAICAVKMVSGEWPWNKWGH